MSDNQAIEVDAVAVKGTTDYSSRFEELSSLKGRIQDYSTNVFRQDASVEDMVKPFSGVELTMPTASVMRTEQAETQAYLATQQAAAEAAGQTSMATFEEIGAQVAKLNVPFDDPAEFAKGPQVEEAKTSDVSQRTSLVSAQPGTSGGGACHSTGAYLASTIPEFSEPGLVEVRSQILAQQLVPFMQEGNGKGMTPEQWIEAVMNDAREFDRTAEVGLQSYNESTGLGSLSDEAFLQALRSNGYSRRTSFDGVAGSALLAAINSKLGAIATRAFARDIRCWLKQGQWPR